MDVLPDVLKPGLKVVFCGTATGNRSAIIGAYYAGRGNQFWAVLHRVGLTPCQLQPQQYRSLLSYGIGLTDLVKSVSGNDNILVGKLGKLFDIAGFRQRLENAAPKALAFNGKRVAMEFLGRPVKYGLQPERVESSTVFILPSTSGAAQVYWNEQYWLELAEYIGQYDNSDATQVPNK